jgi:hypothetical protein
MSTLLPWLNRGNFVLIDPEPQPDSAAKEKVSYWYLKREEGLPAMDYDFPSVEAGVESGWKRMDSNNLDLETDKRNLLFQYFVGVKKKGLIYVQYPVGEEIWTTDKNVPTTSAGHRKAYTDSVQSPYEDPSALTQFFMVQGITIAFNYFNDADHALIQRLKFIGKKFERVECKVGASPLGKPLTTADMEHIKEIAIPLQVQRIN